MRYFAVGLVIFLVSALAACSGIDLSRILTWPSANWADPNDYDAVRGKIEHEYDAGRGRMTVTGPVAYGDSDVFGHMFANSVTGLCLREGGNGGEARVAATRGAYPAKLCGPSRLPTSTRPTYLARAASARCARMSGSISPWTIWRALPPKGST